MTNQISIIQPIISIHNGKAVTTSRAVANCFNKNHFHIIEKIKSLDCSEEFLTLNFSRVQFSHNNNIYYEFEMTKDGFMFLVMGFTGKKAAQFKEAYIKAFNEMEKALLIQTTPKIQPRTIEVLLTDLIALTNDVLWMNKIFSDFKLTEALRTLGAGELACKLDGRIDNIMLGVSLLNSKNILSSSTNPR